MPTGSGKTVVFANLPNVIKNFLPGQIMVVAHREELLDQAADKIRKWNPALSVSIEQADRVADPNADIIVASVATLGRQVSKRRERFDWNNITTLVIDECFPAGTLIDGRPIETIKVGEEVTAFDEQNGAIVVGRVSRLFVNQTEELVRITAGQHQVVCTPNHPFYTKRGWKNADQLSSNDEVYYLWKSDFESPQMAERPDAQSGASLLLQRVQQGVLCEGVVNNHGENKSQIRFGTDDCQQPDGESREYRKSEGNPSSDRAQAADTFGERNRSDCSSKVAVRTIADGHRSCSADAPTSGLGISDVLQVGYRGQIVDAGNRGGREQPCSALSTSAGQEKRCVLEWVRLDSVEVLESGSDGTFGGLCPEGRVYNFEVEGFHTYVANGFVVHNCHHACASTYKTLLTEGGFLEENSKKLLLGVTATPNRADGEPLADIFDEIAFSYPLRQAIDDGWLSDLICYRVKTQTCLDAVHVQAGDFKLGELSNEVNTSERNKIVADAWLEHGVSRQTIVFTVDIQHAVDLAAMFQARGIKAHAVWGDDPARAEKIAAYKSGDIMVLTNCGVLTEGFDDAETSCIVMARPTKSTLLFQQMIGRGTRLETGVENRLTHPAPLRKKNCLILDVIDSTKRHKLATVPSLFGMDSELDLHGHSVTKSLRELEDAERKYPQINLAGLTDIENLKKYIESVSLWEVQFDPEVVKHSALSWFRTMDGGYVLSLPNQDRATIKQNLLGKFQVSITMNGKKYVGERDSLEAAFKVADAAIQKYGGNIIQMVGREQKWHKDSVTDKQLATLRKLYKGKAVPAGLSKGAACKLISQFFAQNEPAKSTQPDGAATEGQLRYLNILRSQGKVADFPANISKRDAGILIGRATAKSPGQVA